MHGKNKREHGNRRRYNPNDRSGISRYFSEKVMIPIQATNTATITPIMITLPFSTPYLNTIGKFADNTRICMHTGMRKSEKFKFCPRPTIRNAAPKTAEETAQQMSPSKYFSPEISLHSSRRLRQISASFPFLRKQSP